MPTYFGTEQSGGENIRIDIQNLQDVMYELDNLYPAVANRAVETADEWLVNSLNTYAQEAPYNYLSWADVGGFISDKQRAFVMAAIKEGRITIPYPRISRDNYHTVGSGYNQTIESNEESMYYSMSDEGQSYMQGMRGWDKVSVLLTAWNSSIMDAFEKGVREGIDIMNKLGLS